MAKQRIIMHIDLDAFFAAVEEREHPEYRGKPLVVTMGPAESGKRGVVSTANYEARKFGLHSGMPVSIAHRKCPSGIFIPANHELYEKVSAKIMEIFRKYADKLEIASIDEAYLDLSESAKNFRKAEETAKRIKKELMEKEKLSCSIGISTNRLVAKIASGFKKPDGLTIVPQNSIMDFLKPLSPRKIPGCGPKTTARLKEMGAETIGELRKISKEKLADEFGKFGGELYYLARGIDDSPVIEEYETKSFNRNHTYEEDTKDKKLLMKTLEKMAEEIGQDLKAGKTFYKTVTVRCRYSDFDTHIKSRTIKFPANDTKTMLKIGEEILDEFLKDKRKIRQIGLRVSNLTEKKVEQRKLA